MEPAELIKIVEVFSPNKYKENEIVVPTHNQFVTINVSVRKQLLKVKLSWSFGS